MVTVAVHVAVDVVPVTKAAVVEETVIAVIPEAEKAAQNVRARMMSFILILFRFGIFPFKVKSERNLASLLTQI